MMVQCAYGAGESRMSSVCDDFSMRETSREQPPVPMTPISPSCFNEARRIDRSIE